MPRGRKKGDGVLKEIDPQDRESTLSKLLFGRTADDPVARMVREGRNIALSIAAFDAYTGTLTPENRRRKERYEERLREYNKRFSNKAVVALADGNADSFRKLARAIEDVKTAEHTRLYPAYLALFFAAEDWGITLPTPTIDQVREHLERCPGCRRYDDREIRRFCRVLGIKLKPKPSVRQSKVFREVHRKAFARQFSADTVEKLLYAEKERVSRCGKGS